MESAVEVVNTAAKVGLKFNKTSLVAAGVGVVVGVGATLGARFVQKRRANKIVEAYNETVA